MTAPTMHRADALKPQETDEQPPAWAVRRVVKRLAQVRALVDAGQAHVDDLTAVLVSLPGLRAWLTLQNYAGRTTEALAQLEAQLVRCKQDLGNPLVRNDLETAEQELSRWMARVGVEVTD